MNATISSIIEDHYELRQDGNDPTLVWWRCGCGEAVDYTPNLDRDVAERCHRSHLVEMLAAVSVSPTNDACSRCHGNYGWTGALGVWEPCPDCDPSSRLVGARG